MLAAAALGCRTREPPTRGDDRAEPAAASEPATPAWAPPRVIVKSADQPGVAPSVTIEVPNPSYVAGTGPRVAIDAGHHNFQIRDNFTPFAEGLRADGYVVEFLDTTFSAESLGPFDVLVVVNALHPSNVDRWELPTPSTFSPDEIAAVGAWVEAGGGLWLIADHHPFPGAAAALAGRFGFVLQNGFAFREPEPGTIEQSLIGFNRADRTIIGGHPITDGARPEQRLERLLSFNPNRPLRVRLAARAARRAVRISTSALLRFTGEAFERPAGAQALFVMPADGVILLPDRAWEFSAATPRRAAGGWAVAAVREQGRGRVAMFGEAAMLSARHVEQQGQWFGVGIVHPEAEDNLQLVLNTARWLAG
ncbi:MAG TPA: hypothetical protein VK034_31045 [Enhygromyxa sp.]|nr:hypothetical protein [Enhygromyxa sp.]